jgi:hypothetical protein
LCVVSMERLIIFILLLTSQLSFADDLDREIRQITDSLKSIGVEKVFVFQYSLFNGRYYIPYDDNELECDSVPTVAHIFWSDNGRWRCQRLDYCGRFEIVNVNADFGELPVDRRTIFEKKSAHFTRYRLTKLYKEDSMTVYLSGAQLQEDYNSTIRTFKKVSELIVQFEDNHEFKRVK